MGVPPRSGDEQVELAPAEMERDPDSLVVVMPPTSTKRPSFFCGPGFLVLAILGTLVLGLMLYIVLMPLTWIMALLVFPALFLSFYLNSFLPLHDWAEKVPVLLIKFFIAERAMWPTPRFADMVDREEDTTNDASCCHRALGELYVLQPKRELVKRPADWGINANLPVLAEAEYINLRSMRLGLSCFWKDIGSLLTDRVLGLMAGMHNTHTEDGGYLRRHGAKVRFARGEDPVAYVMSIMGDVYPTFPDVWDDKFSDDALARLCLHGLGPQRLERLPDGAGYVVRTNSLAPLRVREGYESYGGDCYLDAGFRPVRIVRMEQGGSPWEPLTERIYTPGSDDWGYAKFAFRSSLFTLVTVCEHLYGIHLQWSNVTVVAARERLGAAHPIRQLLTPYYFGTIQVNHIANSILVPWGTLGSRNFAFTREALQHAWRAMPSLMVDGAEMRGRVSDAELLRLCFDCGAYFRRRAADLEVDLPYYQQGGEYWLATHRMVDEYVALWYPSLEAVAADAELLDFLLHVVGSLDATAHLLPLVREMDTAARREFAVDVISRWVGRSVPFFAASLLPVPSCCRLSRQCLSADKAAG